ncbi:hypothetical protein Ndes2526B_g00614 [Nannochloris sp. 'desiccata']|nr:putative Zinc finger CCCH domain-containing protein 10 [Chlorella desiccata (nom. nud.)]
MQNSGDLTGPPRGSEIHRGVEYTKLSATDGSSVLEQNINNKMKSASFSLPTAAPTASASTAQPPAMQQEEPKRQICFDFTKNQCSRGANCKFSHDLNLIIEVNSQEKGICFDFLKGTCSRGPLCRFSHDLRNLQAANSNSNILGSFGNHTPPQNDLISASNRPNTSPICYDFVKNQCSRGPECKYSHDFSSILMGPRHPVGKKPYVMCMDFVRGRCTRGASCKYAHFDPLQLPAGGGGYGNGVTMAAAAQAQAEISNAQINSNVCALAGFSPQQAHALMAATGVGGNNNDFGTDGQQQEQQQYFGGHDGFNSGIGTAWATPQQQHLENEYSLTLMQLQQLALQSDTRIGEGGARSNYNNDNTTSTAEDVMPIPMPLPAGQASSLPCYQHSQQQQSPNDVSALHMLLMQQQRQHRQQQQDQFIRAHRQQQQQQRRPSNLGPSIFPATISTSDTHHYVESNNMNAAAQAVPLSTRHQQLQQNQHQHQNWAVNFHHPLLQKVQSADLPGGNLNNRPGSGNYPTAGSNMNTNSIIMNTTALGSDNGDGGTGTGTNSPTIGASWGTTATVRVAQSNNKKGHASIVSSTPRSQVSSLETGSPLNDGLSTAHYMQQQQQQQQFSQPQHQPGLDALKSIWSKP